MPSRRGIAFWLGRVPFGDPSERDPQVQMSLRRVSALVADIRRQLEAMQAEELPKRRPAPPVSHARAREGGPLG